MTDKEIDRMFSYEDADGNYFMCKHRKIFLSLKKEFPRQRNLGLITSHNDILIYSKPEDMKDIFRKLNAWSIPYWIVDRVDLILFYTDTHVYRISAADIIRESTILHFEEAGIELKVYVPLEMWEVIKR